MYVGVVLLKCLFVSAARPDRSSIQYLSACTKYVHPFFFFFFCFILYDFLGFILQSRSICQAQSVKNNTNQTFWNRFLQPCIFRTNTERSRDGSP